MASERAPRLCSECGSEMSWTDGPLKESIRGHEITVAHAPRWQCPTCGNDEMTADDADRLAKEQWARYYELTGTLRPEEIRELRTSVLGIGQAEFGRLVKVNPQTVSRWENGKAVPDEQSSLIMSLLRDIPDARRAMMERCEVSPMPASVSTSITSRISVETERKMPSRTRASAEARPVGW